MPTSGTDFEISFPHGMPGFDHERRFLLVERKELLPVVFLQSATTPELCFTAISMSTIAPGYELQLGTEEYSLLEKVPDMRVFAILCATTEGVLTANLLAPIVIDLASRVGIQAVRWDSKYSHAHPLTETAICL